MSRIILNIKRGKTYLDVYYMGKVISTIRVSESNRGLSSSLSIEGDKNELYFKIQNEKTENHSDDYYNREEYNK